MIRRAAALLAILTFALSPAAAAHGVIAEQVVLISVERQADQVLVGLHVPTSVFGNTALPPFEAIVADVARRLDLRQADASLPLRAATARLAADGASVDVELRYATSSNATLSARLNALGVSMQPVRTTVRYRLSTGRDQTISVTGQAVRVSFDPDTREVAQAFATRGLRALLDGGDQLLFLLCVLMPVRRARSAVAIFLAGAAGQSIAVAVSLARPALSVDSLTAIGLVAASAVAIAALQNLLRAHARWVLSLTFVFGALNGFAFGNALVTSGPFAGGHVALGVAAFSAVALVGELWLGAIVWGTRTWLDDRGVPERLVAILAAAALSHTALHRMMERGQLLADSGSFGGERVLLWLTLGWAGVMLLIALANALTGQPQAVEASETA